MANTIEQILATIKEIGRTSFRQPIERVQLRDALFAALRRVQDPWDIVQEHAWDQPTITASIKTLIDAGLWDKWIAAGGQPARIATLAELSGIDPVMLKRLLRYLAGQHFIDESDDGDTYSLTDFTRSLSGTLYPSTYGLLYTFTQPCLANFPKYAAEIKYKNPMDPVFVNFNSWRGPEQTFLNLLTDPPEAGVAFNDSMTLYSNFKTPWTSIFPIDELLDSPSLKKDRPIMVDVAGGHGQDVEKLRAKRPDLPEGSIVLQDLENVLEDAVIRPPIIKQAIDMMSEQQPIKGAAIYYLHCIIHDWPDETSVKILENIKASMEKGYSRILLHESVIVPVHPHPRITMSDLMMMMTFSGLERDESMWFALAEKAGLKVTKIWTATEAVESVIQLELP